MHPVHWLAVLRIGVGLWWAESYRHKNKAAWLQRGAGIDWGRFYRRALTRPHRNG